MFKKIKALINPFNLDEVKGALEELGIKEVTISKCRNFGFQNGPTLIFRGKRQTADFRPKIRLEMVVDQEQAGKVIETIRTAEGAGWDKDGRISVMSIEEGIAIEASGWAANPD